MRIPHLSTAIAVTLAAISLAGARLNARTVEAGPEDVIEVRARVRFATVVALPPGERILDWVCGDAEYWSVQGAANLAFVKPTAEGVSTNVTLVTDRGNVYTLLFRETGGEAEPDLKLFLRPAGTGEELLADLEPLGFEPRGEAAVLEREAAAARKQARDAIERAERQIEDRVAAFRVAYPATLRFDYEFDERATAAPFGVRAIWRDDRFTYIRAAPEEVPALYESRDGKPSMVPYDYADGLYVTRRPLGDGWLQIGKRKLIFRRLRDGRGNFR